MVALRAEGSLPLLAALLHDGLGIGDARHPNENRHGYSKSG
jgi:hypothetical protein